MRRESRPVVKWILGIAVGYLACMLVVLALLQYLARAAHVRDFTVVSEDGRYALTVYRDVPLPFWLDGTGPAPGEVVVANRADGHVLDSERIDNTHSIGAVRWGRYDVEFDYSQNGKTYRGTLALAQ